MRADYRDWIISGGVSFAPPGRLCPPSSFLARALVPRFSLVSHPAAHPFGAGPSLVTRPSLLGPAGIEIRPAGINGQPGALFLDPEGRLVNVFVLDMAGGRVQNVRSVINPDKLRHLGPLADVAELRRRLRPPG